MSHQRTKRGLEHAVLVAPIVLAACAPPFPPGGADRVWPEARLAVSEPAPDAHLVENTKTDVGYRLVLGAGPGGATPALDVVVCEGDGNPGDACDLHVGNNYEETSGNIALTVPPGGPSEAMQLVVCERMTNSAGQNFCGHRLTSHTFSRPVYARFVIGLDNFKILHTRARSKDTVYVAVAAVSDNSTKPKELFDLCVDGALAVTVPPVRCRGPLRYGKDDLGDGSYPVSHSWNLGEFEMIPRAAGVTGLNFDYVIWNYGFPTQTPESKASMEGGMKSAVLGNLFKSFNGTLVLADLPRILDFSNSLGGSIAFGCDGPVAGGAVRLRNDGAPDALDALTRPSGTHSETSTYQVESQPGCGDDSRYEVTWTVRRSTWK